MVQMHEPETKFNLESPGGLVKVKALYIYIRTVSSYVVAAHCSIFSRYQWICNPAIFPPDLGLILFEYI